MENTKKILTVEENSKFFNFMEELIAKNKDSGTAKMKDGSIRTFQYVSTTIDKGKKIHYIQI